MPGSIKSSPGISEYILGCSVFLGKRKETIKYNNTETISIAGKSRSHRLYIKFQKLLLFSNVIRMTKPDNKKNN